MVYQGRFIVGWDWQKPGEHAKVTGTNAVSSKGGEIMKVLAISGSPRPQGNTYHLLHEALKVLKEQGLEKIGRAHV